jgi:hypothetical protein
MTRPIGKFHVSTVYALAAIFFTLLSLFAPFSRAEANSTPDIRLNGTNDPVTVASDSTLTATIQLDAGEQAGEPTEWWIVAGTPMGWYYYEYPDMWHWGGNSGKGGDLLYRWGNPQAYGSGSSTDQQLFAQHNARWVESGLPGYGHILIFNNGQGRPEGDYSSVDEIVPPVNSDGSYTFTSGAAYGPTMPLWSYTATPPTDFYAQNISGAQRLPNGNTLICQGPDGLFFEVTASGEKVWEHDYGGAIFRVEQYSPDYAGFNGTDLAPD